MSWSFKPGDREEWRDVIGYEGVYEISSEGRVRNNKGLVLRQGRAPNGYSVVGLSQGGRQKTTSVHRTVALAFLPRQVGRPFVNHKDMNRSNNRIENLEWCSAQENSSHAVKGGAAFNRVLTDEQVVSARARYADRKVSPTQIAREFGISKGSVRKMLRGETFGYLPGAVAIKTGYRADHWTLHDDAVLRQGALHGRSAKDVAADLGRSRGSVFTRASEKGLSFARSIPARKTEDA